MVGMYECRVLASVLEQGKDGRNGRNGRNREVGRELICEEHGVKCSHHVCANVHACVCACVCLCALICLCVAFMKWLSNHKSQ